MRPLAPPWTPWHQCGRFRRCCDPARLQTPAYRERSSHSGFRGVVPRVDTADRGEGGWKPPSSVNRLVELRGFEPLTPSMRTRCATGLRYSPKELPLA
jgi:hypothetical protein